MVEDILRWENIEGCIEKLYLIVIEISKIKEKFLILYCVSMYDVLIEKFFLLEVYFIVN